MLAWVVIFSIDSRRATQYRHVTKNTSRQLLWNLHLQNRDARNPFRIRSYANCRVAYALVLRSSILRTFFQVPYPATPLFATLTQTAGVCTQQFPFWNSSRSRAGLSSTLQLQTSNLCLFTSLRTLLRSFTLFCNLQKLNPFLFNRFRTLCAKTPGWGASC